MADKEQESSGGYLASAKSYIPGMGGVSEAASGGAGKAQEGLGAAGSATKDVTGYVPVVGSIVEGVGNTPVAQKLGGKEEEKGYLGSVYDYAGSALRTVYDAAGNVIGTVEEKAGTYMHGSEKAAKAEGEEGDAAKGEALQKDQEVIAKNKAEGATQETADKASETADGTTSSAKETAGSLGQTASDTTDKVKEGHRGIEDNVESGAKDAIGQVRTATGTTDATEDANKGLEDTVGATKDTADRKSVV